MERFLSLLLAVNHPEANNKRILVVNTGKMCQFWSLPVINVRQSDCNKWIGAPGPTQFLNKTLYPRYESLLIKSFVNNLFFGLALITTWENFGLNTIETFKLQFNSRTLLNQEVEVAFDENF